MKKMAHLVVPDASLLTAKQAQIDEDIDKNTFEIEECLENIEHLLRDLSLPGSQGADMDLEEHLNYVSNYHCIEKTACFDLDVEELQNLFVKLNDFLNKNPNKEGSVLSVLMKLSAHTGFTLPWKSAGHDGQRASMMSLNIVNDEDEQMCEALWDQLRKGLEDHIVTSLYQLPVTDESLVVRSNRADLIERLHLLTSTRQLCQQYRSLRICSLNQLINDQLSSEGDSPTFSQIVNAFERISGYVITMIDGDFNLLVSGIFGKVATTFEIIRSIYFDKLTDEMEAVLDDLANDIYGQVDVRHSNRRQSDYALTGKLKEKINKSKPKSQRDRLSSMGATSIDTDQTHLDVHTVEDMVRLAKALIAVEQHVHNLYLMSYTELRGTSSHSLRSAESVRGVLKPTSVTDISVLSDSLTSDTSELQSILNSGRLHYKSFDKAPQVVDRPVHYDRPQFLWQLSLKRFASDLSLHTEESIAKATDVCVAALTSGKSPDVTQLCPCSRGSKMEYPTTVWKAVANFVLSLESLFPLAQGGHTLLPVKQSFISATMTSAKTLLDTFQKVVDNRRQLKESNRLILIAISSIALLRNTLYQSDSILHRDSEKQNTFVLVYHQACQAVESLAQQYVSLQIDFIHHSLLHDADSFNWSHTQEFFEAERCSFPIQAWSYHMQMLRLDLWQICPPTTAVNIFSDLLRQTLDNITQRYLNESPSHRRIEQYRLDVGVILYTVYELLFYACPNSSYLLDLDSVANEQPFLTIHSSCCKLLASLAIITSPLNDLYRVYKKGYQRRARRRRHTPDSGEEDLGYYSQWMSWAQPHIIPKGITRLSDMQTTTALYLQIKLLLSQPEIQWHTLIQVIAMKNLTLPIMILTQQNVVIKKSQREDNSHNGRTKCSAAFCDGSCCLQDVPDLFEPFLMVLMKCNKPAALYEILLPVINRNQQWSLLAGDKFYQNMQTNMPSWMRVVVNIIAESLGPVLSSIITSTAKYLSQSSNVDIKQFMQKLPCGCNLDTDTGDEDVNINGALARNVLSKLSEEVSMLPISICVLLERLGTYLQEQTTPAAVDCFILQVLGLTISNILSSKEGVVEINGGKLSNDVLLELQSSSSLVYASLSKGADVNCLQLSKDHMKWLLSNNSWIDEQQKTILNNVKGRESLWPDLDVDGGTAESFSEFTTTNLASEIVETDKGERYLRQIYNVIANNKDWIFFSLDIHEVLAEESSPTSLAFVPDVTDHADERMQAQSNPLALYARIGDFKVDFETIRKHTENLSGLLQGDLGISELSLRTQLQRRSDFKEVEHLEPNDRKHVKTLKAKFHITST